MRDTGPQSARPKVGRVRQGPTTCSNMQERRSDREGQSEAGRTGILGVIVAVILMLLGNTLLWVLVVSLMVALMLVLSWVVLFFEVVAVVDGVVVRDRQGMAFEVSWW